MRNKNWYDSKTKQLNSIISELRSFDPIKSLLDHNLKNWNMDNQNVLLFGQSCLHIEETKYGTKYTALNPFDYIIKDAPYNPRILQYYFPAEKLS